MKWYSTALFGMGFVLVIFPPTTPVGLGLGIAGGLVGVGASAHEITTSSHRGTTIQERMKAASHEIVTFQEVSYFLYGAVRKVMEALRDLEKLDRESVKDAPDVTVEFGTILGTLTSALQVAKVGGGIAGAIIEGSEVMACVGKTAGGTVSAGAKAGGVALAGLGAVLSIIDLAYTDANEPPHKSVLIKAIKELQKVCQTIIVEAETLKALVERAGRARAILKTTRPWLE